MNYNCYPRLLLVLFIGLVLFDLQVYAQQLGEVKLVSETYGYASKQFNCSLKIDFSIEKTGSFVLAFENVLEVSRNKAPCDGYSSYDCYTIDVDVLPGNGALTLVIDLVDTTKIKYPSMVNYECLKAPPLDIETFGAYDLFPKTLNTILLRFKGYNKTNTLDYMGVIDPGDVSPYDLIGMSQDPLDKSLFQCIFNFNLDSNVNLATFVFTELTNSENKALTFKSTIEDWGSAVETPLVFPTDKISIAKIMSFSLFSVSGNTTNRYMYSKSSSTTSSFSSIAVKVKGNDQNCQIMIITQTSQIGSPAAVEINKFRNWFYGSYPIQYKIGVDVYNNVASSMFKTEYTLSNLFEIVYSSVYNSNNFPYLPLFSYGKFQDSLNEYPYGIGSGTLGNFKMVTTEYIESFQPNVGLNFVLSNFESMLDFGLDFQNTIVDITPPVIQNITFIPLQGLDKYLLRINITDDQSGFFKLVSGLYDGPALIYYNTIGNNIYETLFDKNYDVSSLQFSDKAGNMGSVRSTGLKNGVKFPKFSSGFTASMITNFTFESRVVNTTIQGYNNTLYFNFTGAAPGNKIMFFVFVREVPNSKDFIRKPPVYDYNTELQLYKIDFYIPQGLYAQNIQYSIGQLGMTYDNEQLYHLLGEKALLQTVNYDANQIPPLITNVVLFPSQVHDIINIDDVITVGWHIEIDTQVRTLDYAEFNVTSTQDSMPRTFRFKASDSINADPHKSVYQISFQMSGRERSQVFSISSASIVDSEGYDSSIKYEHEGNTWALMSKWNQDITITINCPPPPIVDSTAPYLTSWSVSIPPNYSTFSLERKFTVDFSTKDDGSPLSIRHIPIVYLTASFSNKQALAYKELGRYACTTELLNQPDVYSANYRAHCNPGFAFGNERESLLSVYGIVDQYMNVRGYSTINLANDDYEYYVNTSIRHQNPILESSNLFTTPGQLIIRGIQMCSEESPCTIEIKKENQDSYQVYTTPFIFYSSIILSFNYESNTPFYIRLVKNSVGPLYSNELYIVPIREPGSSSSLESSSLETSSSSSSSHVAPSCPGTPPCGGDAKGECLPSGGCKCKYPYYGSDCTSVIIIIPTPKPDPNSPNTTIVVPIPGDNDKQITISSLISVVLLRELDPSNVIIKEYKFTQWIYTPITDSVLLYQTSIVNNNITTNINVTIEFFNTTQIIQFAGQNLTMNPSTIKYKISSDSYSFTNSLNRLQLIMSATFSASSNDGCTFDEFEPTIDQSEYIKLQIDTHSLYGRFIKRGMIDNRATTISNQLLNSEFNAINDLTTTQSYIGINIPFYKRNVVIDPDFSLLVDTSPASDKEGSKCASKSKLSPAKIAGIVIGCVAFIAIIVISVVYHLYKKKQHRQMEHKLKTISHQ